MTIAEIYTERFTAPGVSVEVATVMLAEMRANAAATEKYGVGQYILTFSDNSSVNTKELWAHKNKQNNL
jgi:hypothetical protein